MAAKLNMSNETLLALFAVPETANTSNSYNRTEIDDRISQYNHTIQAINSSVTVQLGNLLSSLLDTYVNASVSNASQKISPLVAVLRDDMNIRFDSFRNSTVRNYQLERNISELNISLANYAYGMAMNVKHGLDQKIDGNLMLAFLMIFIVPAGIYLATTRIYSLRMKILGSAQDIRRYVIEDLGLNPTTQEEIRKRKELKIRIIRLKYRPPIMKKMLDKVDTDEINDDEDIKDFETILKKEEELANEADHKHPPK